MTCPQCGEVNDVAAAGAGGSRNPAACPVCGAAVGPGDAACGACGELLGPLTDPADPTADDRPVATTLGGVFAAAGRDWLRCWLLVHGSVLAAIVLWCTLFFSQVLLGVGLLFLAEETDLLRRNEELAFFFGYGLGALMAFPINCATPLGLAALYLAAVRRRLPRGRSSGEGLAISPLWRARGRRRMMLCGVILLATVVGLMIGGCLTFNEFEENLLPRGGGWNDVEELGFFLAVLFPPVLLWVLFWPLPFLIVDRPDLRHVRPLKACLTLPAGHWGGHLAIGAVTAVLLFLGTLPYFLLWPAVFPIVGLLVTHAYDRYDRAALDETGPRELDPEGVI